MRGIRSAYAQCIKKTLAFLLAGFSAFTGWAQDDLNLNELIGPVDSSRFFIQKNHYSWCSSVIKADGKFHMFYSQWSHGKRAFDDDSMNYIFNGFRGWNKYSEIAYATSDKIDGPFKYVKTILKGDGDRNKWDRFTMHNPQVRKFGDHYYLYYISNSYDSTLQFNNPSFSPDWKHWLRYNCTQKIGVLKFKSFAELLKGKFKRSASPLMQADNLRTFEVTTNPTVAQGPDGKYYMLFKSRKPDVGNMTFWMAASDKPDGGFKIVSEVFTGADMACEDPCMWYDKKRKRFYASVKYYSNSKKLVPQFGALALITSEDGLHWIAANNPLISLRELKLTNGKKLELAHLERPFVVTDKDGQPIALFAAASIKEPSGGDVLNVAPENNTFIVCFSLDNIPQHFATNRNGGDKKRFQ